MKVDTKRAAVSFAIIAIAAIILGSICGIIKMNYGTLMGCVFVVPSFAINCCIGWYLGKNEDRLFFTKERDHADRA